jgi:hypothetical protein
MNEQLVLGQQPAGAAAQLALGQEQVVQPKKKKKRVVI